eukprot:g72475.t1
MNTTERKKDDVETVFDAIIASDLTIDPIIYNYWLNGVRVEQVSELVKEKFFGTHGHIATPDVSRLAWSSDNELFASEEELQLLRLSQCVIRFIKTQYRVFRMLEHGLRRPCLLYISPHQFQCYHLTSAQRNFLIEGYWDFDPKFMRCLLGRTLTAKLRSTVEQIAYKLGLPLASCLRQFDNALTILNYRNLTNTGVRVDQRYRLAVESVGRSQGYTLRVDPEDYEKDESASEHSSQRQLLPEEGEDDESQSTLFRDEEDKNSIEALPDHSPASWLWSPFRLPAPASRPHSPSIGKVRIYLHGVVWCSL